MLDECFVLIPCSTLEDFPTQTSEPHARGLLGAWTAPWHPQWLAKLGKLPQWFRADTVPVKLQNSVLLLPEASEKRLPNRFEIETSGAIDCRVIRGSCRGDFLSELTRVWADLGQPNEPAAGRPAIPTGPWDVTWEGADRKVGPEDFFALGYLWLQIQLMTRRLRYTSNLDEIHFSSRVIEAARALVEGRGEESVDALHDAYDVLAEERDHYFSADPNLIDLTLLAPTTLGKSLERALDRLEAPKEVPVNVLIDPATAAKVAELAPAAGTPSARLLGRVREGRIGLAGGAPDAAFNFHHQTFAGAAQAIGAARQEISRLLGRECIVYARPCGETPADLGPLLADGGFRGAIPIDLASGSGWKEEAKLIWQSGGVDLDVLVSRPIDASGSVDFLALGPKLGQAIDSGEIATALLVHWPDQESEAYRDLRRAASWGLAMGRFRDLDDYFVRGERPFHHFRGRADEGAGGWLTRRVAGEADDPLSSVADAFLRQTRLDSAQTLAALATLINPRLKEPTTAADHPPVPTDPDETVVAARRLCRALGGKPDEIEGASAARGALLLNPHPIGQRVAVRLAGGPAVAAGGQGQGSIMATDAAGKPRPIFVASRGGEGGCDATVDLAAGGFVFLDGTAPLPSRGWFKRRKRLAEGTRLSNEFMEVELSPKTGGVQGVYSGKLRGNRYSLRLVHRDGPIDAEARDAMVADAIRVIRGDESVGEVLVRGRLIGAAGGAIASFETTYRLVRGSRWLEVRTRLEIEPGLELGLDPWGSYFAFRSAVSANVLTLAAPLRDRMQRVGSGKRVDSPGGILIDEVERQTLLFTEGRPAHLRVGDRFLDSLLIVRGERRREFGISIGMDVPEPGLALRAIASPPSVIRTTGAGKTGIGWLVNCSAPDIALTDMRVESESPLMLSMNAINTSSDSRKFRLRFCRDCRVAETSVVGSGRAWQSATCEGDRVELAIAGHDVVRLRVEFALP